MSHTMKEQRDAAERELRLRRQVYSRRVEQGRMTARQAAHETAVMESIVETLTKLELAERLL